MKLAVSVLVAVAAVAALAGSAEAYPQFQLSRDKTCTGCHISPAGGNLLSENGETVAEGIATLDHNAKFMYGKIPLPSWLLLGGDLRGSTGYIQTPEKVLASFPMQIELYAHATFGGFSIHANGGPRPANEGPDGSLPVWSREHYLMYRTNPGAATGMFVRAGRFMPIFGLRFAEHPMYTRRFGGTPLYGDTYGASFSYIADKLEAHVSGFIEDPVIEPVQHVRGGAVYAELRPTETLLVGGGGMLEISDFDKKLRGTVTGKLYAPKDLLFQAEVQVVNQRIDAGGAPVQLIGNLTVSRWLTDALMLDVGLGHFDSNVRIRDLDRDCLDLNLHWFTSSHIELILNARYEMLAFGNGGPNHMYALLQMHYRL
jgi:hypothetical protein